MKHLQLIFSVALAGAVLAGAGCAKNESDQASSPPPPSTTTIDKTEPLPVKPSVAGVKPAQSTTSAVAYATNSVAEEEETPAQLSAQVKKLENDYKNTSDLQNRVSIIYDLSSVDSTDTVDAVGRLFLSEKDQDLKIELIDSLNDIDGQNDKKLAILSNALRGDQPKDVRMEAIDAMGDVEDKRGIQILQLYASDTDEDVRDSIKDTIDQLQTATSDK